MSFLKSIAKNCLLLILFWIGAQNINAQCIADFSVNDKYCDKDTVEFTFTGNGNSFEWNFGNPASGSRNIDTSENPKHLFTATGVYDIQLVVFDSACTDTTIKQIRILENPKISFSFFDNCKDLDLNLNSKITLDSADSIRRVFWFADNNFLDSGENISHSFSSTSSVDMKAVISTVEGCSDSFSKKITIYSTPEIETDKAGSCLNQDINFSLKSGQEPSIKYRWNFGDSSSSSSVAPAHQYSKSGKFEYSLLITYTDSSTCLATGDSIIISDKPNTNFVLLSDSNQCFFGNQFCFAFAGRETNLASRSVTFGDGNINNSFPLDDTTLCYTYTDTAGGVYSVTYEAIDVFGCSNSTTFDSLTKVEQKNYVNFTADRLFGCFSTTSNFTNLSNVPEAKASRFIWDFGDGNFDSTNWNPQHTYTKDGIFRVELNVFDNLGCQEQHSKISYISNINFTFDTYLDKAVSYCRSNNEFHYVKPLMQGGGSLIWVWGDGDTTRNDYAPIKSYANPGVYYPKLTISRSSCLKDTIIDAITISGPKALVDNITNRYQCTIHDTVYFENTSLYDFNQSRVSFWDFGDPYAPACTTNLALGQNVGMNCRYSTDSILTKHYYSPGKEQCYFTKLVVTDTIVGCVDSIEVDIPLIEPKADIDLGASPPRTGLALDVSKACITDEIEDRSNFKVNLTGTQPSCGRQNWWIMWDSLAATKSGSFNSHWDFRAESHKYTFNNPPADTNGFVTLGLIIENGKNASGIICRDTSWYHNYLHLEMFDPEFISNYDPNQYYCKGSEFTFQIKDSTQKNLDRIYWDWGDGTPVEISTNPTKAIKHTFNRSGNFKVKVLIQSKSGCIANRSLDIKLGFSLSTLRVGLAYQKYCTNTDIPISYSIFYTGGGPNNWTNPSRILAGKEAMLWDMGDGLGYQNLGVPPYSYKYTKSGIYTVSYIARDSVGCLDTLTVKNAVTIRNIETEILSIQDTFICAQNVQLKADVYQSDSTSAVPQDPYTPASFKWDFGHGITPSTVKEPTIHLKEGVYNITLTATDDASCKATAYKKITVVGPIADFDFVTDSSGCQPHYIELKNNSIGATNYIWRFNDSAGNVLNTNSDTNTNFTYLQFGEYFPSLTAQGVYSKNGINISCSNTFPDPDDKSSRKVVVMEIPKPDFSHSTNCFSRTTQFTNESKIGTSTISNVKWDFGDGNTSLDDNPVHQYSDTGRFTVELIAFSDNGCSDTLKRTIVISPTPIPNFSFTQECAGVPIKFIDSTKAFNDEVVKWYWDFDDSTSGNLDIEDKTFAKGGVYDVKLIVTNIAGCSDSVSKSVRIFASPEPDFSISNQCSNRDIVISNLSAADTTMIYKWNFDDGTYSVDDEPEKEFPNDGVYNVKLRAVSGYGCYDSITKAVTIIPGPISDFSVNGSVQCFAEHNFVFTNNSSISSGSFNSDWNFGDGNTSSSHSPSHIYSNPGAYDVDLITTAPNGCADTSSIQVTANSNPSATIGVDGDKKCLTGNEFTFSDLTTGTISREWLIDGNSRSDSTFKYKFSDTGSYIIRLVAKSSSTCTDTTYHTVEVLPMPVAKFSVNSAGQCINNQNFSFTDETTLAKYPTWTTLWDFGDGQTSSAKNPSVTYYSEGVADVTLYVESSYGCKAQTSSKIEVYPKPKPTFLIDKDEQCQKDNIFQFTNNSTVNKGSLSYNWKFGDGSSSSITNPNHRYTISGQVPVKLIATSSFGCVDSTSKIVTLRAKPSASILVNAQKQCINPNLFTLNSNSKSNEGNIISYEWNIPSQSVKSIQAQSQFSYSFDNYGVFPVKLFVTTNYGCADSTEISVEVYPKPEASFSLTDTAQCINKQNFSFLNSTTIPHGTLSYQWKFGDGGTSVISSPLHSYSLVDTFNVQMIAVSGFGCRDTSFQTVITYPKPNVNFSINDNGQCLVGNLFELTNISNIKYGSLSYYWDLGNGKTSTQKDTQINYPVFGTYKIILQAESDNGCIDTLSHTVRVYPKPVPEFIINQKKQCLNENLYQFKSQSTVSGGTIYNKWLFDNEQIINGDSSLYIFDKIGLHKVKLYSSSNFGCIDSIEKEIRIWANPTSSFSANNSAQCINTQNFQFTNQSTIAEGNIVSQFWNFGYGDSSLVKNPSNYFHRTGKHRVSLISYSDSGCLDSFINFIDVYPKPTANFDINDTAQCLYTNLFEFYDKSTDTLNIIDYNWLLGKDSFAYSKNTSYKFKEIGYHNVELQIISELGCADSVTREIYVKPMPDASFDKINVYYCRETGPISFNPITPGGTFYGKHIENNLYYPDILWRDTIEYKVTVNGCLDSSSQVTQVYPIPKVFLGSDTLLCKYEELKFDVSFWNSVYEWQDRNREPIYTIKRPGLYRVSVSNFCGTATDSIYVEYNETNCRMYLPNAFSPNSDGLNDYYQPVSYDVDQFSVRIFDRWGELVYKGTDKDRGWDGKYQGFDCPPGIYIVQVTYSYGFRQNDERILNESTSLHLIR